MKNKIPLTLFCLFALAATIIHAQPVNNEGVIISGSLVVHADKAPDIEVRVTAENAKGLSGTARISRSELDRAVVPSGATNDALRLLPDPQFDYASRDSMLGGEILPPQVSISGGKPYENLYLIDGIGSNNYINPIQSPGGYVSPPTSTPSGLNLDIALLDNITVHRSRISAEYSGFTGGVISAEIRKPLPSLLTGALSYKTTRSDWTEQHVQAGNEEDFLNSSSADMQPEFEIHRANLWMNIPLSSRFAALVSYNINYSKIPLQYNESSGTITREQHRQEQIFLAKVAGYLPNDLIVDASVTVNPYKASFFQDARRNCDWSLVQDTFDLQAGAGKRFSFGLLKTRIAYGEEQANRSADSVESLPWRTSPTKNWGSPNGYAYEGAQGDYDTEQHHLTFKGDLKFEPFRTGSFMHQIQAGLVWERISGDMYEEAHTNYAGPRLAPNVQPGPDGVVPYEQYFPGKSFYESTTLSADFATTGLYVEDQITIGPVIVRPGMRFSYDDLFENFNVAPRLSALWRILPHDRLSLAAGVNRYYGTPLLSYLLRRTTGNTNYSRTLLPDGTLTEWKRSNAFATTTFNAKELDTPHSDEFSIEPMTHLWGFDLSFEFLYRRSRDGISQSYVKNADGTSSYIANNEGRGEYMAYSFSAAKTFGQHTVSVAFSASDTKSNYENYDTMLESDYMAANYDYGRVIYNDELITREDLPARNYNRPWRIVGRYDGRFFSRLELGATATYEDTADRIITGTPSRVTTPDGALVTNYYGGTLDSSFTVDLRVAYDLIKKGRGGAKLVLEVTNVFDDVAVFRYQSSAISTTAYYSAGRQVWAGVEFSF